jgi:hypothetical protein
MSAAWQRIEKGQSDSERFESGPRTSAVIKTVVPLAAD